ncbi:MAG: LamG-like jellyroll fold domain-containing protein [Cytophagales bacterium]|nr:LamG-like jellyroll fold domain-containing protein [Cytophagales bacterium]
MVANCQSEWSAIQNFSTPAIPTEGLVAWYPFNGNANDESGNGNHGVVIGATLTSNRYNKINGAYSFDGINDYINITNPTILNFANAIDFTVSFFYSPESIVSSSGGFNGIISRFHNNTGPTSGWQIGRDNIHLRFEATNPCGNDDLVTLTLNNWIHVLQTYDRTNGIIKTYINSTLVNTTNCNSILSSMINNYDLKIGVERGKSIFIW